MRINRLFVEHIAIPLKYSLATAQVNRTVSCSIILQVEFDNGLWGYGESTPRPYVTGETTDTVFNKISLDFLPVLKSAELGCVADVKEVVNRLGRYTEAPNGIFHGSALCAVELALLDGLGKLLEKPVQFILGDPLRREIEYSIGFPYVKGEEISKYLKMVNNYQPKSLKIKIGRSSSDDIERVAKIRDYLGDKVELRVDANCRWDLSTAVMMAGKLERLGVVAIEQPLAKNDIEGLKKLKHVTSLKIIADESACSLNDVKKLVEADACDLVSIKISKCGGLVNSLNISDYLYDNGKACTLGAHAAETEILEAAGMAFGVLAKDIRYFEGYVSTHLFKEAITEGINGFNRYCSASPSLQPGLGIALRRDVVKKYTVKEWSRNF